MVPHLLNVLLVPDILVLSVNSTGDSAKLSHCWHQHKLGLILIEDRAWCSLRVHLHVVLVRFLSSGEHLGKSDPSHLHCGSLGSQSDSSCRWTWGFLPTSKFFVDCPPEVFAIQECYSRMLLVQTVAAARSRDMLLSQLWPALWMGHEHSLGQPWKVRVALLQDRSIQTKCVLLASRVVIPVLYCQMCCCCYTSHPVVSMMKALARRRALGSVMVSCGQAMAIPAETVVSATRRFCCIPEKPISIHCCWCIF